MRRWASVFVAAFIAAGMHAGRAHGAPAEKSGALLFVEYCSGCHAGGGNSLAPGKHLRRNRLHQSGGLSRPEADRIAGYILEAFR